MSSPSASVTYRVVDSQTGEIIPDSPNPQTISTHLASPLLPLDEETSSERTAHSEPHPLVHSLLEGQGTERWRRQLQQENRDKVIVFIGNDYGIFDTHEFLVLTGVPIQCLPPHLSSPEEILIRYGCAQPRPGARLMEDSD